MPKKLVNLAVHETSGVDHPAHLHEGWIVMKAGQPDPEQVEAVMERLREEVMRQDETEAAVEVVADETVETVEAPETDEVQLEAEVVALRARVAELESALAEREPVAANTDEVDVENDLMKSVPEPVRAAFADLRKQAEDATAALRKERDDRADAEAIAKARDIYKHLNLDVEKVAPALRRLEMSEPELAKAVTDALASANAQNESADIFTEVGKSSHTGGSGDAYSELQSLAKARYEAGQASSMEQAVAAVVSEQPDLYARYLNEKGA